MYIAPVPYSDTPVGTFAWLEWFRQVRDGINATDALGAVITSVSQTLSAINTPKAIPFDTQTLTGGVTVVNSTKVTVPNKGKYLFTFSAQMTSNSGSAKTVWFWPRKNGVDFPLAGLKQSIANNHFSSTVSRQGVFSLEPGDYIEAYWASDSTNISLEAGAATAFAPSSAAVVLTIFQVA
jgi:hypothetical protein